MVKNFLMLLSVFILLTPNSICYAHVDPNAGSIATQLIAGPILAVLASIGMYWKRITGKKITKG